MVSTGVFNFCPESASKRFDSVVRSHSMETPKCVASRVGRLFHEKVLQPMNLWTEDDVLTVHQKFAFRFGNSRTKGTLANTVIANGKKQAERCFIAYTAWYIDDYFGLPGGRDSFRARFNQWINCGHCKIETRSVSRSNFPHGSQCLICCHFDNFVIVAAVVSGSCSGCLRSSHVKWCCFGDTFRTSKYPMSGKTNTNSILACRITCDAGLVHCASSTEMSSWEPQTLDKHRIKYSAINHFHTRKKILKIGKKKVAQII